MCFEPVTSSLNPHDMYHKQHKINAYVLQSRIRCATSVGSPKLTTLRLKSVPFRRALELRWLDRLHMQDAEAKFLGRGYIVYVLQAGSSGTLRAVHSTLRVTEHLRQALTSAKLTGLRLAGRRHRERSLGREEIAMTTDVG
jgi:hypothetical protein